MKNINFNIFERENLIYYMLIVFSLDMITTSLGFTLGLSDLNPLYSFGYIWAHLNNILLHTTIGGMILWYYIKNKETLLKLKGFKIVSWLFIIYYLIIVLYNINLISSLF